MPQRHIQGGYSGCWSTPLSLKLIHAHSLSPRIPVTRPWHIILNKLSYYGMLLCSKNHIAMLPNLVIMLTVCSWKLSRFIFLLPIPLIANLRGSHPIACSGKPNPSKWRSHLDLRTRGGRFKSSLIPWELSTTHLSGSWTQVVYIILCICKLTVVWSTNVQIVGVCE